MKMNPMIFQLSDDARRKAEEILPSLAANCGEGRREGK